MDSWQWLAHRSLVVSFGHFGWLVLLSCSSNFLLLLYIWSWHYEASQIPQEPSTSWNRLCCKGCSWFCMWVLCSLSLLINLLLTSPLVSAYCALVLGWSQGIFKTLWWYANHYLWLDLFPCKHASFPFLYRLRHLSRSSCSSFKTPLQAFAQGKERWVGVYLWYLKLTYVLFSPITNGLVRIRCPCTTFFSNSWHDAFSTNTFCFPCIPPIGWLSSICAISSLCLLVPYAKVAVHFHVCLCQLLDSHDSWW